TDGAIINADMICISSTAAAGAAAGEGGTHTGTGADLAGSREFGDIVTISTTADIDRVNVQGAGGIIGLFAQAFNIRDVTSTGGFGMVNCVFDSVATGRFGNFT